MVAAASARAAEPPKAGHALDLVNLSAQTVRGRVMVVTRSGRVIADRRRVDSTLGTSYRSRPEVATALNGDSYQETRASQTLGTELLATAVPILHGGGARRAVGACG